MRIFSLVELLLVGCFAGAALISAQTSPTPPVPAAKAIAIYAPKPVVPTEAVVRRVAGAGVFLLHVRPDGTVSHVETLQSTGHRLLNQASIDAFLKWRFRPGSVQRVKIPVQFTGHYPQGSVSW